MKVLFKESSKNTIKEKITTSDINDNEKNIFCCNCNSIITNYKFQISKNGAHKHTFPNPHGIVFEIGCFRDAPGCAAIDEPSNDFSWFSGYNWRIAVCSNCSNHLGWLFTSSENIFFGLILEKIYYN